MLDTILDVDRHTGETPRRRHRSEVSRFLHPLANVLVRAKHFLLGSTITASRAHSRHATATIATAHPMLAVGYYVLDRGACYEFGEHFLNRRDAHTAERHHPRRWSR